MGSGMSERLHGLERRAVSATNVLGRGDGSVPACRRTWMTRTSTELAAGSHPRDSSRTADPSARGRVGPRLTLDDVLNLQDFRFARLDPDTGQDWHQPLAERLELFA